MPRYSYVIAFPVLMTLCIGINIQRYPAVSAMLQGESVESRWLGRSEVFDFENKKASAETAYQSSRIETDEVAVSKGSREPIPLSESRAYGSSVNTGSTGANTSDRYGSSYGSNTGSNTGSTGANSSDRYGSSFSGSNNGLTGANTSDRYAGLYSNSSNTGSTSANTSDRYGSSYNNDTGYNIGSTGANTSDRYGSSYGDISSTVSARTSQWGSYEHNYETPSDRYLEDAANSESHTNNENQWPDFGNNGSGSSFRTDTPAPGYSSRFTAGDGSSEPTTPTSTEAIPATPRMPRSLSLQEKLELRMATPFSLAPSGTQTSSEQYIPPDFLPSHENGVVNELTNPSNEPATSITPIHFHAVNMPEDSGEAETNVSSL